MAENFSDRMAAPLLYMFLGGVPLTLCYKAVNTMAGALGIQLAALIREQQSRLAAGLSTLGCRMVPKGAIFLVFFCPNMELARMVDTPVL